MMGMYPMWEDEQNRILDKLAMADEKLTPAQKRAIQDDFDEMRERIEAYKRVDFDATLNGEEA